MASHVPAVQASTLRHGLARRWRRGWSRLPRWREHLRARIYRALHPGARPRKQIVICGFPRSGTSLLYNMLAAALPGFARDVFEASALQSIWRFEDHLSKLPLEVLRLGELCRHNVHAKQIHVIVPLRDPRDLVTSIHPNVPDDYFIGWEASYRVGLGESAAPSLTMPGIREIDAALRAIDGAPGLDLIRIRFEDLVREPDAVERELAHRLGVAFDKPLTEFHRDTAALPYRYEGNARPGADLSRARETGPVDPSRAGKWREPMHCQRIRSEFGRHPELLALVREWGYEADDAWFAAYRDAD